MPSMYAKLMSRITESSLMEEPLAVRYCFIMMLAIADPQGYVIGTDIAIARRMNVPVEDFRRYLEELMKPDPHSNSHEEDGRRVIVSDAERGYYVVNYRKYRDTRDEEQRREYMKEYMREVRAKKQAEKAPKTPIPKPEKVEDSAPKNGKAVNSVNSRKHRKLLLAQGEGEGEVEENTHASGVSDVANAHSTFITDWHQYYEKRFGEPYCFQGGKDGKAVKTLLGFFKDPQKAKDFIRKCHKRIGDGYPFSNASTLHDIATNISRLQAALVIPAKVNGKPAKKTQEEELAGYKIFQDGDPY